jgi:hypothetical protein
MASFKQLAEELKSFNVSEEEKNRCAKKAMISLNVGVLKGEIKQGQRLIILKTDFCISLIKEDQSPVFYYAFEELRPRGLVKADIQAELAKFEKLFVKDTQAHEEFNDVGFFRHSYAGTWCNFSSDELMEEIKTFTKRTGEKPTLKDCDVKTCKINGRKYKRVTLTHDKYISDFSNTEFAFGTFIHGWTYLVKGDSWKGMKDELKSVVNYVETEFGSSTRHNMDGTTFKAKH